MKRKWIAYALCFLIAAGCAAGAWAARVNAGRSAASSLELLLPLSQQIMSSDKSIVIKHADTYQNYSDEKQFLDTGRMLGRLFELPEDGKLSREEDHILYRTATTDSHGADLTMLWVGFFDHTSELILTGGSGPDTSPADMIELQRKLTDKLQSIGIKPQWNVMIQGVLAGDDVASSPSPTDWLVAKLQAKQVEQYEDNGSTSITYYSPFISEHISNGKQAMNLQVAVHRNSITQEKRVTIGTPAITIEY
ncbi:hypothetical protein SK3146_03393 [Paenibacillus konkukensis]|uniref:TATA-box binding n=1 Tax=Paenibacillus konkukensis TaxID=2020716 RepID=A0ABY4RQE2_9BACL|nr:YwmB family TATA-box binding protein [Paenibacillus konkukensis]UQZ84160.1 hypothetical protein SK3146_03393 [Paenibacillus konkukensis]